MSSKLFSVPRRRLVYLMLGAFFLALAVNFIMRKPLAQSGFRNGGLDVVIPIDSGLNPDPKITAAVNSNGEMGNAITDSNNQASSLSTDSLSPEDQLKLGIFNEILKSKNDNDPRLDSHLKTLTENFKNTLKAAYQRLAKENRSDRGMVVYLLGRNINSKKDIQFLASILTEKPCQSLDNCNANSGGSHGDEVHLEATNQVTLVYPELTALKALEHELKRLETSPAADQSLKAQIKTIVMGALSHPSSDVSGLAASIISSYFTPKS